MQQLTSNEGHIDRRKFLRTSAGCVPVTAAGVMSIGATQVAGQSKPESRADTDEFWSSRDRLPLAMIVDDPMPCVNPLYYFRLQVRKNPKPAHNKTIPISLLEQFVKLVEDHDVRGGFTIIPYPAGIGSIATGLPGFSRLELDQWLNLARQHLVDRFDIHPEVLTHTLALDLKTKKLRDVSEHDWMGQQNEATLTDYFSEAMRILREVGLPCHGVTQPCGFDGDEDVYAKAILGAEKRVNNRTQTPLFS